MGEHGTPLSLGVLERPAAAEPVGALVLLHGRGASAEDLYPLLDAFDPERRLLGLTPQAPLQLPPGGWHWYRLGGIPTPDPETFWPSLAAGTAFLDALPFERDRIVLGGFSQGSVMSYALALGTDRPPPAAIVAMSGFAPQVDGFSLDPEKAEGLAVWVSHGSQDPVIPAAFGRAAAAWLEEAGARVTLRETPYPHAIDPRLLPDIVAFVRSAIP